MTSLPWRRDTDPLGSSFRAGPSGPEPLGESLLVPDIVALYEVVDFLANIRRIVRDPLERAGEQ